jgi:hypothetical protein
MKKSAPARWLVGPLLVLQLTLLAGCNSQQESPHATPAPAIKAVQATAAPTTSTSSVLPNGTVDIPAPIPTRADPTTAADLATKLAENPMPTFGPTETPSRNVGWLVDLLSASQAMTITAFDNSEVRVSVDPTGMKQLVEDGPSSTTATVSGDEWLSQYTRFPGYGLELEVPTAYDVRVYWASPTHFIVFWSDSPNDSYQPGAYYIQENSALWSDVSRMAPVAHYPESSVRYLLDASTLRVKTDEYDYTITGENAHTINAARDLANATLTKDLPPEEEPMLTLYFTVNNVVYEVKIWDNYFTYNGQTYRLVGIGPGVRAGLAAD